MTTKRGGKKKGSKKRGAHKKAHKGHKKGRRKAHRKGHKTQIHIPNITTMASRVGKALGAGLKRPAGAALKRAKGKTKQAKAIRSIGKRLAPKRRGKK